MASSPTASGDVLKTSWSLVDQVGIGNPSALARFLGIYREALVAHLAYRRGIHHPDAEDLVQSFILDKIMLQQLIAAADRSRGRFRNFLLTSLDNYAREKRRAALAHKRLPDAAVPLDERFDSPADDSATRDVEVQWVRNLLDHAIEQMRRECMSEEEKVLFDVLDARVITPALDGTASPPYAELASRFGFHSPLHASNTLQKAKRIFARHIEAAIKQYTHTPEQVREEIRELFHVLEHA